MMDAAAIVRRPGLRPHPEGGRYRETFPGHFDLTISTSARAMAREEARPS
jgi:predicted cupin superfamily sugar epimerase